MSKIHIKVQLPSEYDVLHVIKRVNYPFNQACQRFMLSVIRLAEREELDVYSVFGRIGHALANDTPQDWVTDNDELVKVDYKESNDEIIAFYRGSSMTNKQITTMFLRLMVRLCHTHGPHLADLVYLIDTLPSPDSLPVSEVQPPVQQTRPSYAPKPVQPKPVQPKHIEPEEADDEPAVQAKPVIKKRKVKVAKPEPVKEEPIKEVPVEEKPVEEKPVEEKPVKEEPKDDFLARAEKVRAKAQEALNEDITVERNPLMNDFFDEY